jgi:hypothetical protein
VVSAIAVTANKLAANATSSLIDDFISSSPEKDSSIPVPE